MRRRPTLPYLPILPVARFAGLLGSLAPSPPFNDPAPNDTRGALAGLKILVRCPSRCGRPAINVDSWPSSTLLSTDTSSSWRASWTPPRHHGNPRLAAIDRLPILATMALLTIAYGGIAWGAAAPQLDQEEPQEREVETTLPSSRTAPPSATSRSCLNARKGMEARASSGAVSLA